VMSRSAAAAVEYPSSDGKARAGNQAQRVALDRIVPVLRQHFPNSTDVLVGGDLLWYYERGEPRKTVAPDAFVALGVPRDPLRHTYKVWREGKVPDFALEVSSPSSAVADVGRKRDLYERLGVREYFVYDPSGDLHQPRLQGFRLVGGHLERILSLTPEVWLESEQLGLALVFDGGGLLLWDPVAGIYLRDLPASEERGDQAEARAAREARLRRAAEARADEAAQKVRELQALVARLKGEDAP